MLFAVVSQRMSKRQSAALSAGAPHTQQYREQDDYLTTDAYTEHGLGQQSDITDTVTSNQSTSTQKEGITQNSLHVVTQTEYKEHDNDNAQDQDWMHDIAKKCESEHVELTLIALQQNVSAHGQIEALRHLILTTNTRQRQHMKKYLKAKYQFDLDDHIHKHFKGIFKRLLLYALQTPMERHLYLLSITVKKSKDINDIIPLLCIYDGVYIKQLLALHSKGLFEKSLEDKIVNLSPENSMLRSFLVAVLNGNRPSSNADDGDVALPIDDRAVMDDVLFLSKILRQSAWNQREEIQFVDVFSRRSFAYLKRVMVCFESVNGMALSAAIKRGLSCSKDIGYAVCCILLFLRDRNAFYRRLLTKGIVNGGHKHILFWRVMVDRMDEDLAQILSSYGVYEGGKSDVGLYNLTHFVRVRLMKEDVFAAQLIEKMCKF